MIVYNNNSHILVPWPVTSQAFSGIHSPSQVLQVAIKTNNILGQPSPNLPNIPTELYLSPTKLHWYTIQLKRYQFKS
ncbi:unnamed protein product [Allacma fusca]|uniref:Uncharacterized protein n=1 Tax=Allacma fusca TaxID=39272 RepID=A0A8J2KKJ3_9HEXA|nr:unnamed protein product [Allacma fusca]